MYMQYWYVHVSAPGPTYCEFLFFKAKKVLVLFNQALKFSTRTMWCDEISCVGRSKVDALVCYDLVYNTMISQLFLFVLINKAAKSHYFGIKVWKTVTLLI